MGTERRLESAGLKHGWTEGKESQISDGRTHSCLSEAKAMFTLLAIMAVVGARALHDLRF